MSLKEIIMDKKNLKEIMTEHPRLTILGIYATALASVFLGIGIHNAFFDSPKNLKDTQTTDRNESKYTPTPIHAEQTGCIFYDSEGKIFPPPYSWKDLFEVCYPKSLEKCLQENVGEEYKVECK